MFSVRDGETLHRSLQRDPWPFPGSTLQFRVVAQYKHLGSIASAPGSNRAYAKHRVASAVKVYAPIAARIFGSPVLKLSLKMLFLGALVLFRLFFNVEVRILSGSEIGILNAVFMRVFRKITGHSRFASGGLTDKQVREIVTFPAIDSLLVRMRLKYLRRLVCGGPSFLIALLGARCPGTRQPLLDRVHLVSADLQIAWRTQLAQKLNLPDPVSHPDVWHKFMREKPAAFDDIANGVFFHRFHMRQDFLQ